MIAPNGMFNILAEVGAGWSFLGQMGVVLM